MDCRLALFIDFENVARGIRQRRLEERIDLRAILGELEAKGRILIKRAYADWGYYKDYRSDLLQHGIEPVQVFAAARDREGWKNGADIRIAIDAIETAFRFPDITDFVLVTGDSDFLSLVTRLRECGKTVWGVGLKTSSSHYLVKSCDHYLFYEEIAEWLPEDEAGENGPRRDSRALLLSAIRRMTDRQGLPGMPPPGTPLKATAVKAAIRRLDPAWDEKFEGHPSFVDFLHAHDEVIFAARPGEMADYFVAERGSIAEVNLRRMCEAPLVLFTTGPAPAAPPAPPAPAPAAEKTDAEETDEAGQPDEAPSAGGPAPEDPQAAEAAAPPEPQPESQPESQAQANGAPPEEVASAIRRVLQTLGAANGTPEAPQRNAVRGTLLRSRLRQELPDFDEAAYGHGSFLEFLLSLKEQLRVARADTRGDLLVAERGSPAEEAIAALPEAALPAPGSSSSAASFLQTPEHRYLAALRVRRIRYAPMEDRYKIIRALCRIFDEARSRGEDLSLKEAKDRLHEWFEENEPAVSWDSVNNVVYHLFWTYCFDFGEGGEEVPLWDRPTCWSAGIKTPDEVIRRCDTGLVRMISEMVGVVDARVVLEVLGDHDSARLPYFEEICAQVNGRFAAWSR